MHRFFPLDSVEMVPRRRLHASFAGGKLSQIRHHVNLAGFSGKSPAGISRTAARVFPS
jgi:hypothetical protein